MKCHILAFHFQCTFFNVWISNTNSTGKCLNRLILGLVMANTVKCAFSQKNLPILGLLVWFTFGAMWNSLFWGRLQTVDMTMPLLSVTTLNLLKTLERKLHLSCFITNHGWDFFFLSRSKHLECVVILGGVCTSCRAWYHSQYFAVSTHCTTQNRIDITKLKQKWTSFLKYYSLFFAPPDSSIFMPDLSNPW